MQQRYGETEKKFAEENVKLTDEYKRITEQFKDLQAKFIHFQKSDVKKFEQVRFIARCCLEFLLATVVQPNTMPERYVLKYQIWSLMAVDQFPREPKLNIVPKVKAT